MARIYLHRLTVTVITTEESPDRIESMIDGAADSNTRIDARTERENRNLGPCIQIADPPSVPAPPLYRQTKLKWADAYDAWLDTWPTVADFDRQRGVWKVGDFAAFVAGPPGWAPVGAIVQVVHIGRDVDNNACATIKRRDGATIAVAADSRHANIRPLPMT